MAFRNHGLYRHHNHHAEADYVKYVAKYDVNESSTYGYSHGGAQHVVRKKKVYEEVDEGFNRHAKQQHCGGHHGAVAQHRVVVKEEEEDEDEEDEDEEEEEDEEDGNDTEEEFRQAGHYRGGHSNAVTKHPGRGHGGAKNYHFKEKVHEVDDGFWSTRHHGGGCRHEVVYQKEEEEEEEEDEDEDEDEEEEEEEDKEFRQAGHYRGGHCNAVTKHPGHGYGGAKNYHFKEKVHEVDEGFRNFRSSRHQGGCRSREVVYQKEEEEEEEEEEDEDEDEDEEEEEEEEMCAAKYVRSRKSTSKHGSIDVVRRTYISYRM